MKKHTLPFLLFFFLFSACNLPLSTNPTVQMTDTPQPQNTATVFAPTQTATAVPSALDSADPFLLAILTPAEFADALTPLADFKNQTGLATRIITLEEITQKCQGRDEAEQVKTCLANLATTNGIHFAMLVGDMDRFPVRFTKADRDAPEAAYTAFFPTDLYYADLFKSDGSFDDWDANHNGYFGEMCGEITSCPLNNDQVDLIPDIAVGRIPASSLAEIETYVKRDMIYETNAANSTWAKNVLLIATKSYVETACISQDKMAKEMLAGFTTTKLYESGSPCEQTTPLSTQSIIDYMNQGAGFVSYIGHGDNTGWFEYMTTKDLFSLENFDMPSIVFSTACGTAEFGARPPADAYVDIDGTMHVGNAAGEVFKETPPQPAAIQLDSIDGFGEVMTTGSPGGAVAYIGAITGSQGYALDLNRNFFEALSQNNLTVGDMWMYMIRRYYETNTFPETVDPPDWTVLASFHQPWKFILFGDPSLRIGGVPLSQ
jgi:hypothetical protein